MAPILTIFGRNRSRRPKLKFEKNFRAVVAVVVGVVVVDRRGRRRRLPPCPSSPLPSKVIANSSGLLVHVVKKPRFHDLQILLRTLVRHRTPNTTLPNTT